MTDSIIIRKARKLVRDPKSFFSDSPNVALQRLGGLLKRAPQPLQSQPAPHGPTEEKRRADHADDARRLAGFAAALAATDYPSPTQGVLMGRTPYREVGLEFLRYFIKWGDLTPEDDVLDVGCGGGRMAAALGYYLASSSTYVGFDVHKRSIDWCREAITPRWPNFRFDHFDIGNSHYNPRGGLSGQSFPFPYGDSSFSFVIATSVFTHQPRQEVKHYLREVARVLRPEGRFFATAFLMTPTAETTSRNNGRGLKFIHEFGENPVKVLEDPLAAVAQRERVFMADVNEAGLVIDHIAYGWWSGLRTSNSMQDIIVLRKP